MQIIETGKTTTGGTETQLVKTSSVNWFVQIFVIKHDAWETLASGNESEMWALFNRMTGK